MRSRLIFLALCLTACNSATGALTPAPAATRPALETTGLAALTQVAPTQAASATAASAVAAPTDLPTLSPAISPSRVVSFTTADGVNLQGTLYGDGRTAVILSTMGAQRQETWAPFAREIAARGYQALTYNFRYWVSDTKMQDSLRDKAAEDLRAAVAFARQQGAQQVVLVGASLGGLASIKEADTTKPAVLVVMAAPFGPFPGLPSLQVDKADLQAITAPKLFINTEHDEGGFTASTRQMFEAAPDPKEIHIYPGSAHGTDLFDTEQAADLTQRLIDFIERNAPAAQ